MPATVRQRMKGVNFDWRATAGGRNHGVSRARRRLQWPPQPIAIPASMAAHAAAAMAIRNEREEERKGDSECCCRPWLPEQMVWLGEASAELVLAQLLRSAGGV
ncbi:uncharacterized protein LOC131227990 isoform X3 [Magnolia sinica]|uniref:uncharacterized protein LOC131227990 isoform X3 n=1 Tax=Magnolia sinica TaxID=86752 RepID=UPI00265943BD|nr:uncharacterized protein LOC131227990 isoform X3 [Magnolia sinica]XP_058079788.1 uncharacterized protein LOC131227990 isoform X3 [Magnolia sinica]